MLYYNPELVLQILEEVALTQAVMTAWFSKLGLFKRRENRKTAVLALTKLLQVAAAGKLPATLTAGLPQVISQISIQAVDCWRLRKEKAERDARSESSSEDSEEEDEDDCQELDDHEDADHSKYFKKFQKLARGDDDDDDDDSDDSSDSSEYEEEMAASALDSVDELAMLAETLKALPPAFQQQVATILGPEMPRLQKTLAEAAENPTAAPPTKAAAMK